MKTLLHGIVASSLLLSLSLPIMATESATQTQTQTATESATQTSTPIQTQTLYHVYYDSRTVKDFLDYRGNFSGLPSQVGTFDSTQGELYRSRAENRVVVHSILEQVLTPDMSETQMARAIYDFPMYNYIRDDTTRETLPDAQYHTPYNRDMVHIVDRGTWLLSVGTGGCQEFSYLFNRLMNTAGLPTINVYGNYVNRDGSSQWHAWNRAKVDGVWYWYDVDVEGSVFRRGDVGSAPIYYLYQKDTAYWHTNHTWEVATYDTLATKVDTTGHLPAGTLFSYDMPVEVQFNSMNFTTDHHIYGLVDMDCDEWRESISLLPFHDTLNYLGISTYYDSDLGCLVAEEGGNKYEFFPDSYTCWENGNARNLASSLKTIDGVDYISSDDIMLLFDYEYNLQYYSNNGVNTAVILFQGGKSTTQPGTTPEISTPSTPNTEETTPVDPSAPIYYLYHKESSYWRSNHSWEEALVWAKEGEIASMNYLAPSTITPYEGHSEILFDGEVFVPSQDVCAYVDIDSDFFTESIMLLPFLEVMDFLGYTAYWDGSISKLVLEAGEQVFTFYPNSRQYEINGVSKNLAVPLQVIGDVDYISADEIILLLGYDLNMDFYQNQEGTLTTRASFQSSWQ